MRIRRKLSKEDKEMRRYCFFKDALWITEKFKRFSDTTFTQNYIPTFRSYQELETSRLTYAAKEERDTRIITDSANQIQDTLKGRLPKGELNRFLHHLRDLVVSPEEFQTIEA